MKISICIPTYKRPQNLNNLLSAIIGMNDERVDEVLIGISYKEEDSIDKNTLHLLRALEILNIPYTLKSDIPGLLAAKRWFKETAKNDVLLVADDDCIIHKHYLDLVKHFENSEVVGVSGSLQTPLDINYYTEYAYEKIENPEDNITCNTVELNEDGIVIVKNKYQVYMLEQSRVYECECLVGTAMFIRKDYLCPDEMYNLGRCSYEEYDYTYSAFLQGKKLLFDSSEIAFHLHENIGGMRVYKQEENKVNSDYFKKKYSL